MAENGEFKNNIFLLKNVKYYDFKNEEYKNLENYNLKLILIKKIF